MGLIDFILGKDIKKITSFNDLMSESNVKKTLNFNEEYSEEISKADISKQTQEGDNSK